MGDGHGHLKDVGALGTAQRGVAPAMIVAQGNFDDPGVLMIITLVNLAGVVALIIAAKTFSRDNKVQLIEPIPPQPRKTCQGLTSVVLRPSRWRRSLVALQQLA